MYRKSNPQFRSLKPGCLCDLVVRRVLNIQRTGQDGIVSVLCLERRLRYYGLLSVSFHNPTSRNKPRWSPVAYVIE